MKKIKVMLVFGTRPEAIKMAPLALELNNDGHFDVKICVTAQHRQMLDQVLSIFGIKPDFDLDIMKPSQSLSHITSSVLHGLDKILSEERPDLVLVHGDTTTTFAAALSAFYAKIPVGHVEAGLRTYNIYSPFPEEVNRRLTSHISTLHFAPTQRNKENLLRENITNNVFVCGNTVIDAIKLTVKKDYKFKSSSLQSLHDCKNRIVLVTAHRRENLGLPLENICAAVKRLAEDFPDVKIVYPVHLNPSVQKTVYSMLSNIQNVILCEPLCVEDMHNLIAHSYIVLTDSGGLQEEAPALGKPVIVMRNETERPEAIDADTVRIAGVEENNIYSLSAELLTSTSAYKKMSHAVNPYGDGRASKRIAEAILYYFGMGEKPKEFIYNS